MLHWLPSIWVNRVFLNLESDRMQRTSCFALALSLLFSSVAASSAIAEPSVSATRRAEAAFNRVRQQPPALWAFLKDMPKGGDLHSHLSGAIYAESMIDWAVQDGLCVDNKTLTALSPPCDSAAGRPQVKDALADGVLYRRMVDAWSMRNAETSGLSGHDQFFDSFGKFGLTNKGRTGEMLAEVAARAHAGGVSYLELMQTPGGGAVAKVASQAGWRDDFAAQRAALMDAGLAVAVQSAADELHQALQRKDDLLQCASSQPQGGCGVAQRFLYQVLRGLPKEIVFAQMLTGFELASRADSPVVGLNLVMPEDAMVPMRDFGLHMHMLDYLHSVYPKVKISLHAGELTPGLVPPEGLRFHIRDSIALGHASRIGHGVSVMQEDDALGLLNRMARDKILVEICLTSNAGILGVRGKQHPLAQYLQHGVPAALATDDEGVSRSEMTHEYVKAAQEQNLSYRQLKTMARNSLEYAFVQGASLWQDLAHLRRTPACAKAQPTKTPLPAACSIYLQANPKAQLQWNLEAALVRFEQRF